MKILDLTFSAAKDNLACDEALLDEREALGGDEVLRFWSPKQYFAVLGYSNPFKEELKTRGAFFRRCSGGGTVLQGPGCLNYSLILKIRPGSPLENIRSTNEFIMERQRQAMETLLKKEVSVKGHTDLTLGDKKFSGNAQRRKKGWLLFHGTFLLDFDIPRIEKTLRLPDKQPAYRSGRAHGDFVMNLFRTESSVKKALAKTWKAKGGLGSVPLEMIKKLSRERYSKKEWNEKF